MKSWIRYIFLSAAAWGALLTSCNNVLDEEGITACDDKTATVHLTISFGGDEGPMSRDVGNNPMPKDDDLDYTTEGQAAIVDGDIYALVVDEGGNFLYRITDLKVTQGPENDNYYTRTLEGTMRQTTDKVKIVLLANLTGQGINSENDFIIDDKGQSTAGTFIDNYKDKSITELYNALIYNYGTTPWDIERRKIPMWGESTAQTVNKDFSLDCYLYRAVAKVQIWVNNKDGIDGFKINSIKVNNINNQGYCVSKAIPDDDIDTQYTAASVPENVGKITSVTYQNTENNTVITNNENGNTLYCSDMIYLPEQKNIGAGTPATITVNCTYNYNNNGTPTSITAERTIEFRNTDTGAIFDIIRNHSYIFNIYVEETDANLYYTVTTMDEHEINIPPFQ